MTLGYLIWLSSNIHWHDKVHMWRERILYNAHLHDTSCRIIDDMSILMWQNQTVNTDHPPTNKYFLSFVAMGNDMYSPKVVQIWEEWNLSCKLHCAMHTNNLQTIVEMYYKFPCAVLNKQLYNLYIMFRSFKFSDFHQYCMSWLWLVLRLSHAQFHE